VAQLRADIGGARAKATIRDGQWKAWRLWPKIGGPAVLGVCSGSLAGVSNRLALKKNRRFPDFFRRLRRLRAEVGVTDAGSVAKRNEKSPASPRGTHS
jgi:hypothetical protein